MKSQSTLSLVLIVAGLIAAMVGAYALSLFFNSSPPEPPQTFTKLYDLATPVPLPTSEPKIAATLPGRIHSFSISPDLKTLAIATTQGLVLYSLETSHLLHVFYEKENVFSVDFSADDKKLAMGSLIMQNSEAGKPHLVVWDTSTWRVIFEPKIGNNDTTMFFGDVAWSPKISLLATSDYDRGLVTFDIKTGQIISLQQAFLVSPYDISWSPNGSRLVATGDLGFGFRRWRIDTDEFIRVYDERVGTAAEQVAWSPNGERIASIHANGALCFWNASTNHCDGYIKAHWNRGFSLAWSPDGNQLATGGGVIRIWDTRTGNLITSFGFQTTSIYSQLKWLANGTLVSLETGYADQEPTIIRFWDMDTGEIMMEFHGARSTFGE
jgi:WD40 repeat protein